MAIDVVAELVGELIEGVLEIVFHGARGWGLFWRIVIIFVIIPAIIFGICYYLT